MQATTRMLKTTSAALLAAAALALPLFAHGTPTAHAFCAEPPTEITRTVPSRSPISVTRIENFKRVDGLIRETVTVDGVAHETLSIPDWLSQSYGGNRVAIERDIDAGLLKDRGRCI